MRSEELNAGMPVHCKLCGALLDNSRFDGLCPACTWTAVLDAPPEPAGALIIPAEGSSICIPGHEVLEEIARGGMGVVYRARQMEPDRIVALKMLLPHRTELAEMRERFRLETRAIAALDHPTILPVYQVGEYRRLPYFTMKYVAGGSLATRRDEYCGRFRETAALVATLADAIHFAHEHGVLHRDLKPANILFDKAGRPYVSDFGLAKFMGIDSGLTQSACLLGTPHYVAPEVAARCARFATTASDVYSLGAILYELLTGRLPFQAEGVPALLKKIIEEQPARMSGLNRQKAGQALGFRFRAVPDVPRHLQVICFKCLAKQPTQRYSSAHELAEDLRRWLEGRPILAQPISRTERALNWAKRRPAITALLVVLFLALATSAFMLTWSNKRLQQALGLSHLSLQESFIVQARLERKSGRIGQKSSALSLLNRAVAASAPHTSPGRQLTLRTELAGALALPDLQPVARWPVFVKTWESTLAFNDDLSLYAAPAKEGGFSVCSTADQRALWHFPGSSNNPPVAFKFGPARAPSGSGGDPPVHWVAVMLQDGSAEVHELASRKAPIRFPGSPDGRVDLEFIHGSSQLLVAGSPAGLTAHDLASGTRRVLIEPPTTVTALQVDPSGARIACFADKAVHVLRSTDASRLWSVPVPNGTVQLAWSSNARCLAIAESVQPFEITVVELEPERAPEPDGTREQAPEKRGVNGNFNLVNLGAKPAPGALSGRIVAHFQDHELSARHLAFYPDGGSLVSVGWDNRLVWRQLVQSGLRVLGHAGSRVLDFSTDGRLLAYEPAYGHLGLLQTTHSSVFHEWNRVSPPDEEAGMLTVKPDGTLVATSSARGIQFWDPASRSQIAFFPLPKPSAPVRTAFHPHDNKLLYSALGLGVMEMEFQCHQNVASGKSRIQFGVPRPITTATNFLLQHFAGDDRSLIVLEACDPIGDTFRVWRWPDADPDQGQLLADAFPLERFELSHDERWGVSSHLTEQDVWVWQPETRRRVARLNIPHAAESRLSPDGRWLLVSTAERHQLWQTGTWEAGPQWPNSAERGNWASAFSADGSWAATTTAEGHVEIRSIPDAQVIVELPPPQLLRFQELAFSPDRQRLYLWQSTGRLLEWDLRELRKELARHGLDWRD